MRDIFPGEGAKLLIRRAKDKKSHSSATSSEEASTCSEEIRSAQNSPVHTPTRIVETKEPMILTPCSSRSNSNLKNLHFSQVKSPEYTIYRDCDIQSFNQAGNIPEELVHRLIRGTIHNMNATAFERSGRKPSTQEILEMSKSIVLTYPSLNDAETGHGVIFKRLKKRLYNTKVVSKPQGKSEKKSDARKKLITDARKKQKVDKEDSYSDNEELNVSVRSADTSVNEDFENDYCPDVMTRHYNALRKETEKKQPNYAVVNMYLNKEFQSRRNWLQSTSAGYRYDEFLKTYPSFKNHIEIIEEVRRILNVCEGSEPSSYMNKCLSEVHKEIDTIIYFAVSKKNLKHPKSPRLDKKSCIHLGKFAFNFPIQEQAYKENYKNSS